MAARGCNCNLLAAGWVTHGLNSSVLSLGCLVQTNSSACTVFILFLFFYGLMSSLLMN